MREGFSAINKRLADADAHFVELEAYIDFVATDVIPRAVESALDVRLSQAIAAALAARLPQAVDAAVTKALDARFDRFEGLMNRFLGTPGGLRGSEA